MENINLYALILIFVRVSSIFMASPIMALKSIPKIFKILFCAMFSWIVYYSVPIVEIYFYKNWLGFSFLIVQEAIFGIALGYIVTLIFIAFQMAGQFMDFQMGFAMSTVYDPLTNNRVTLYGKIYYWIGFMLFFGLDGQYYFVYAIVQSFKIIPVAGVQLGGFLVEDIIHIFSNSFLIAFQIGMPVIFIILMTDIIMGILGKTVPQLNVLILGLPLKVLVGLLTVIIMIPALMQLMIPIIRDIPVVLEKVITFF